MTELRKRKTQSKFTQENYPHHLPDKPFPMGKITYEEFLDWADEDTLAEWVDGEIELSSPASIKHQRIAGFLYRIIHTYVKINDLGEILQPPTQMKLPGRKGSGREPDLIFVAKHKLNNLRPTFIDGAGDLVVEVVSPESVERDRETKFEEYAEGKVPEYWLVDTIQDRAEFYRLNQQGEYELIPLDSEGKYFSQSLPGFWLREEWLWQEPLPTDERVLLEVSPTSYLRYMLDQMKQAGFDKSELDRL